MKWLKLICRLVLAALFIWAAQYKIREPDVFALAIFRFRLLPYSLINISAICLPWIELIAAVLLLIAPKRWREAAAAVIWAMLLVFTVGIGLNLMRGADISCGCFSGSTDDSPISLWNIARNMTLLVVASIAAWPVREVSSRN